MSNGIKMMPMRTLLWLLVGAGLCGIGAQTPHAPSGSRTYPVQLSSRLRATSQAEVGRRMNSAFAEGIAHPAGVNNCSEMLAKSRETLLGAAGGPAAQGPK